MKKVSVIIDPLWTIMKLSALQLFLAFLAGAASFAREGRAQELLYKKVSIQAEHKPIKEILTTLEAKANVKFVYSLQLLPVNRRISIDVENKTLAETLDKMFFPDNITYETVNKKIVLKLLPAGSSLVTDPPNGDVFPEAGQVDEKLVAGKVLDDKNAALPGVNIAIRGTTTGTITDADGKYSLKVADENAVLVFSYVGYVSKQVQLQPGQTTLDVFLVTDEKALSEVVVIGYGTAKKKDVTGAVSTISAQAYKDQPVVNASAALQGRVPGVTVVNNSGAPGGGVKIRVRGANSINASNDPLYVVDGVALSSIGIQELNVNDIESMDILKDASATAVYGSRGANGVIIITTKSGKSGPPKIEYNGFASFNRPMKRYKLMDATTYADVANVVVPGSFPDPGSYAGKSTDWQRLIFDNSVTQSHQISATGGSESTKYYVSGFYIDQQGLLINSGQKRFGLRTNMNIKISRKLSFGVNLYAGRINSLNNGDIGSKGNRLQPL
jgi:TonB-linked SusC/RagA family outer membrane protein